MAESPSFFSEPALDRSSAVGLFFFLLDLRGHGRKSFNFFLLFSPLDIVLIAVLIEGNK